MSLLSPFRRLSQRIGSIRRGFARAEGGVVSVELAFIAPVLGFLILGLVDFGETISRKMQLANAVRAGTQYALVRKPVQGDVSQITASVQSTAPADATGTRTITTTFYCECPDATVITCDNSCPGNAERKSYISIVLEEDYWTIFTYPGLGNSIKLRNDAVVRLN